MLKFLNPINWKSNTRALWAAFILPALIMTLYFAIRHMAPFGDSTILTVDLGQQYIDFFAAFKHIITQDPSQLFYSFSKGLGGETYGDWAYYLFSPLNLLLLPFDNVHLPSAILWLTVIKYGLTSWSFAFALHKMHWQKGFSLVVFGTTYAFMGWFVANQLNLLWLDAAILLPLIILGLEKALDHHSLWGFILPLTAIMIINYYMAYMIGIFLVLYMLWRLFWDNYGWKRRLQMLLRFSFGALISIGLSCFAWLPTAYTLMNSKSQYMLDNLHWRFDYFPPDILGKFFVGTFNFDQMPTGLPNIFVGSLPLILFWFFITSRTVRWQVRVVTILVTAFLVVSMMYSPLNLFWHGFQFPVWYPYRFSFVFCFWLIWIGASIWQPRLSLSWIQAGSLLIIAGAGVAYLYQRLPKLNFLDQNQLIIGCSFFLLILLLMTIERPTQYWQALLGIVVLAEVTCGALLTLNNFNYLSNSEYQTYIKNLNDITKKIPKQGTDFFRVAQNFQRTKGDPFQAAYNGGSTFSSALEYQQSKFMALIGQPEGDNYVDYTSGTLVSDSLLAMRYLLQSNQQEADRPGTPANMTTFNRHDTDGIYHVVAHNHLTLLSKNPDALPIGFAASQNILNTKLTEDDPIENQNQIWQKMYGYQNKSVFHIANFSQVKAYNTTAPKTITGAYLSKDNAKDSASLDLYYRPTNDNPYYLTLGDDINDDNVEIRINNQVVKSIPDHRHTIILPLAGSKHSTQKISLIFKKKDLWLQNVSLYQADANLFKEQAKATQAHSLKLKESSATRFSGEINIPKNKTMLMTSIPNTPGWQISVDGHTTNPVTLNKFMIGIPMKTGVHHVSFKYVPPFLKTAITISIGTLLFVVGLAWSEDSKRQHRLKS